MRGVGATQANRAQALLLLLLVVDLLQVRGLHVALPVLEPLLPLALASRVDTEVYKLEFEKAMQQSAEVMETKQKVVSDLVAQAREVRGVSPTRRRRSSLSGAAD